MKKAIVFGATGQLGCYSALALKENGFDTVAVGRRNSDGGFFASKDIRYIGGVTLENKDPVGKSRALKTPRQIAGEFCVQRQISIRIRYCCIHIRCFRIHCRIRHRRSEEG